MKTPTTIDLLEVAKFSQHANRWWDKNGPFKTLHDINPVRLEYVKKHVNLLGRSVLDIGCGGGLLTEAMAKEGAQVVGLDADAEVINMAQQHAFQYRDVIQYICQPVEEHLPLDIGIYDVITCMEMLEHVKHPLLVIQHARRLLKPGGILFLSTINRTLQAYAGAIIGAEYLLKLLPRQTHDYDKFIKPHELGQFIREVGLEVQSISGISYNPFSRKAALSDSVGINYLMACQYSL